MRYNPLRELRWFEHCPGMTSVGMPRFNHETAIPKYGSDEYWADQYSGPYLPLPRPEYWASTLFQVRRVP
jgi:hypothetical protein